MNAARGTIALAAAVNACRLPEGGGRRAPMPLSVANAACMRLLTMSSASAVGA
jgi:hypothetical protein